MFGTWGTSNTTSTCTSRALAPTGHGRHVLNVCEFPVCWGLGFIKFTKTWQIVTIYAIALVAD